MENQLPITILADTHDATSAPHFDHLIPHSDGIRVTAIVPSEGIKRKGSRRKTASGIKARNDVRLLPTTERFERQGDGCACCTVRSDLMTKIKRIALDGTADHVVIQLPSDADLGVLSKTFTVADKNGARLSDVARVERVITTVNGVNLMATLQTPSAVPMMERIQIATTVALEGADALSNEAYDGVVSVIRALNGRAKLVRTDHMTAPTPDSDGSAE